MSSTRDRRKGLLSGLRLNRCNSRLKIRDDVVRVADVELFHNPLKKFTRTSKEFESHRPHGRPGGLLCHLGQLDELRPPLAEHLQERQVGLPREFLVVRA